MQPTSASTSRKWSSSGRGFEWEIGSNGAEACAAEGSVPVVEGSALKAESQWAYEEQ